MATKKEAPQKVAQQETVTLEKYNQLMTAAQQLEKQLQSANARLQAIANIVNI